jgi:hypothetical protein
MQKLARIAVNRNLCLNLKKTPANGVGKTPDYRVGYYF